MTRSSGVSATSRFPTDVLDAIAAAVSNAAIPHPFSSLDPLHLSTSDVPLNAPSACPAPYWSEPESRKTLANLCLVSKDFHDAAKPWLWRRLEVNFPRNWLRMLDVICGEDEEPVSQNISTVLAYASNSVPIPPTSSLSSSYPPLTSIPEDNQTFASQGQIGHPAHTPILHDKELHELTVADPSASIPLDLLSPPASRDPSPQRLRAQSPGRWQFIREVNRRIHAEPGLYGMCSP